MPGYWLVLLAAAVAQPADWPVAPRLERGQELIYRGLFEEKLLEDTTPFSKAYDVEIHAFVLEVMPQSATVAVMTVLRPAGATTDAAKSVRLELGLVDRNGRFVWQNGGAFAPPLV